MTISGTFKDYQNRTCQVTFTSPMANTNITIGDDIVKFSRDPVTIDETNDDNFNTIIRKSAQVNLVTKEYLGKYLFGNNSRSISVVIQVSGNTIFNGYVDPNTFNQPYTTPLDEFTINCIDKLSTLEYYNYKNANVNNYDVIKHGANNVTFKSILDDALSGLTFDNIYYDRSVGVSSGRTNQVFDDLIISELKMMGESADDVWTRKETLHEILQYLNLHIKQEGNNLYIFNWKSIQNRTTSWRNLQSSSTVTLSTSAVTLSNTMHSDRNTSISIADVYNQISVKCDIDSQDTVVESPLDKSALTSLYSGKQLYMTEYISEGSGDRANDAINALVQGNPTTYSGASEVDWYIKAMSNPNWKFYIDGTNVMESLAEKSGNKYINQWKMAKYLKEHSCVPYIFQFGSVDRSPSANDNSPTSKVDMKNYLYISVNGNEWDTTGQTAPTEATIYEHRNMCEFISNVAGGSFSPTDDETTNYLVFSGKLLLQPIVYESTTAYAARGNHFEEVRTNGVYKTEGGTHNAKAPLYDMTPTEYENLPYLAKSNLAKSENNDEGRYYSRKFYTLVNPTDKKDDYPSAYLTDGTCGVQPWAKDKSAHGYQYNYTKNWDSSDQYSKLPILECELIIGNKRLIETNIDLYGNSTFQWVTLGEEPTETYDGVTYPITTFTLGVNPKIGDYIIGQEYDIQNTIDYTMNIDAEGTAIPIKKTDNVSGAVMFRILGLINLTWEQITRRHPSFWLHTRWDSNTHGILAHCENVIIQDFECKVYSDNALNETSTDNDLIYMSDETNEYINKKDDITFKYITQLSSAECLEKGIPQSVNLNSVINGRTNLPLTGIWFRHETDSAHKTAKAEEHYVNQYYLEYAQPKIIMETQLHSDVCNWRRTYTSVPLSKSFYVLNKSDNIRECTSNLTLKEI